MVHTFGMMRLFSTLIFVLGFASSALHAQDSTPAEDEDGSSEQVEQREDSYRQQMELEDARSRDRTYVDNTYTQSAGQEKIDKLPKESRENIRDQLVDIIVENGEWEPKDALEEYPYTPTAAAQGDPELKQQEQEAWEEQIEKYHEREAAAFGTHRGPVPGPGNPTGQEGGQQGEDSQQGQQGGQQGSGQAGEGASGSGSAGTYQPGANGSEEEISTAGVSESALDFLRGGQGRQQPPPQGAQAQADAQQQAQADAQQQAQADAQQQAQADAQQQAQADAQQQAQADAQQQAQADAQQQAQADAQQQAQEQAEESEQSEDEASPETVEIDTRGIIAIEDLDKLEGANVPTEPEDEEDP